MSKTITGLWSDAANLPQGNAVLFLTLSHDALVAGTSIIVPSTLRIPLTTAGTIPPNKTIWANDELLPVGTTYTAIVIGPGGSTLYGPETFGIVGVSPINLNNLIPTMPNVSFPSPVLQNPAAIQSISGFSLFLDSAVVLGWGSSGITSPDTGLSRTAAGIVSVGNGTAGDTSGTIRLTAVQGPGYQKQIFTSSGTFTIPTGVTQIKATVIGGGGGGAGAANTSFGCGGTAAGTAIKWLTGLTPGNTITVTVGAAGTAGTNAPTNGGNGGASSIASGTQTITTVTANGGFGGISGSSTGGSGGTCTNGDINITGAGNLTTNTGNVGTAGRSSTMGGGAPSSVGVAGTNATGFGSGGSGGSGSGGATAGGTGSGGIVLMEWIS